MDLTVILYLKKNEYHYDLMFKNIYYFFFGIDEDKMVIQLVGGPSRKHGAPTGREAQRTLAFKD